MALTDDELLTAWTDAEVAQLLRRHPSTIVLMSREPGCPVVNIGSAKHACRRWPREKTLAWLESRNRPDPPPVQAPPTPPKRHVKSVAERRAERDAIMGRTMPAKSGRRGSA